MAHLIKTENQMFKSEYGFSSNADVFGAYRPTSQTAILSPSETQHLPEQMCQANEAEEALSQAVPNQSNLASPTLLLDQAKHDLVHLIAPQQGQVVHHTVPDSSL
jgi:hypothetical protein